MKIVCFSFALVPAAAFMPAFSAPARVCKAGHQLRCSTAAEPSLGDAIELALQRRHAGAGRVLDSWQRLRRGDVFEHRWEGKGLQQAGSYMEGLSADPWHDKEKYKWALGLEENWKTIAEELREVTRKKQVLAKATNAWVPAALEEALAYGPDWRTLVLQDRQWEETNAGIFKKTTKLIRDLGVPSCEVFFARQDANSGIKAHTDNTNFILTMHLGLDVPEGKCWIRVGDERRYWRDGEAMVFDTSFEHETANEADAPRTVLLIRFWHPEVTAAERDALNFIFAALEDPDVIGEALRERPPALAELELEAEEPEESEGPGGLNRKARRRAEKNAARRP